MDLRHVCGFARVAVLTTAVSLVLACLPQSIEAGPIEKSMRSVGKVLAGNSQGTGFIVDRPTLVVTNYHVVHDANDASVVFPDGTEIPVKGFFLASPDHDLVILELASPAVADPLPLCDEHVDVGTDVYAIGAPRGLEGSVSKGIVSAYRKWTDLASFFGKSHEVFGYSENSKWVQTDAAINHGNSGGPLVSQDGRVLAVNTLGSPPGVDQNINFAVDIDHVRNAIDRMPDMSRPLTDLPRRRPTLAGDGNTSGGDADKTLAYWDRMAAILGTYLFDDTKIRAKAIGRPLRQPPVTFPEGTPVGLDDPMFGKTRKERQRRLSRMASEVNVPYEDALKMTFSHLRDLKSDKLHQEERERREAVRAQNMSPLLLQLEAIDKAAAERLKRAQLGMQMSAIARKAASDIEALPSTGVNPGLVDYAIKLKTGLLLIATKTDRTHRLLKAASAAPTNADSLFQDAQEAAREMDQATNDFSELVEITGGAVKSKLKQIYDTDVGPIMRFTEEQSKVIEASLKPQRK